MFNIRAVSLDHYISRPIDELYDQLEQNIVKEWQEPVLRIFGATADGLKSCVHVHGVYPYIYVPYKGGENAERDALLLGVALDEALRSTLNPKVLRFVHRVNLVSGIPLYGYHSKHRQFFKIYFYNPFHIKKALDLLLSGAILGQKFQPHEAHIPYVLQFMMDYNIYGMSFVTFSKVKYRRNPENPDSLRGVREEDLLSEKVKKMTWSRLEVDAWASDILNRTGQKVVGVNPGLRALWEDEQNRRRAQNRNSQMTLRQSQSRPDPKTHPTEAMYKARLARKLAEILVEEPGASTTSGEPAHSYPAEVPENRDLLEASAVADSTGLPRVDQSVGDASGLIDERILTQISGSEKERAESESEEEMEFDSVLGRNQKSEWEEEAEPEDEEGVDMTQPLEADDEVICGADGDRLEPGHCGRHGEEAFWRDMADKIFQLDGAQESSSESETEAAPAERAAVQSVCDGSPDPSSPWSSNIMSILSECSDCPTPSAACPTPRTFWFDYPSDLLSQNQDTWIPNKSVAHFSEFAGKNQHDCLGSSSFPGGSKEVVSGEPYSDLFVPNGGDFFPTPLPCDQETAVSPPSVILTPASEGDRPDVNPEPFYGDLRFPPKEKRKVPSAEGESSESVGKLESDQQKVLQVLKSFSGRKVPSEDDSGHLTLKQYIKDCKEIVSVDFKNLCNREMIVIEYKSQNKRSQRNKYLIKPLDKFLESWNSAERKASDRKDGVEEKRVDADGEKNLRSNYVINVLEKRFSDTSTVQSMSNKLTVKSMEILPDGGGRGKSRCYNVNENVISRGEIKMKLMKSQSEKMEKNIGETPPRRNGKCLRSDGRSEKARRKRKDKTSSGRENVRDDQNVEKYRKWNDFPEPDTKLINEINSSFEEYFKSIVKRKSLYRQRRKNIIGKMNCDEDEEDEEDDDEGEGKEVGEDEEEGEEKEETSEDERASAWPTGKRSSHEVCASSNADPIKFVTRFLSTFSRMSDVPPLSITIRLGNSRASIPVKVNLRPPPSTSEKGVKRRGKQHGRKSKIESVDGPADDSSSEESANGGSDRLYLSRTKSRRDGRFEPLDVVIYGSPREKKGGGRKRKAAACDRVVQEAEEAATRGRKARKSFPTHPHIPDRSDVCREKPNSWPPRGGKQKISSQSLVKSKRKLPISSESSSVKARGSGTNSHQELDFIADSEEEWNRDGAEFGLGGAKRQKTRPKVMPTKIPQADMEAVTTSDDDDDGEMQPSRSGTIVSDRSTSEPPSEAAEEQKSDFGLCRELSGDAKVAEGRGPSGSSAYFESRALGRVSKPWCQEALPGTSLLTQTSLSPLTLSGSPLFASSIDSPGSEIAVRSLGEATGTGGVSFFEGRPEGTASTQAQKVKILRPTRRPPSRKSVAESVRHQDIESEDKAPFYGDPLDATKAAAAGLRMLKIETHSLAGLKPFRSSLDVSGVDERRRASSRGPETVRWRLVGNEKATITPLMKPPGRETVSKSFLAKNVLEDARKVHEMARLRMRQPSSPGQEMGSEEEVDFSLTVSSFSPAGGSRDAEATCRVPLSATEKTDAVEAGRTPEIKGGRRLSSSKGSTEAPEDRRSEDAFPRRSTCDSSDPSAEGRKKNSEDDDSFRIRGATLEGTFGFSRSVENVKLSDAHQYMSLLAMEVHVRTREDLLPDPEHDPIRALFYAMCFDDPARSRSAGVVMVGQELLPGTALDECSVHRVPTEKALVEKFVSLVRQWDPEILTGYETEMHSWGYLVQRGFVLEMDLLLLLGRVRYEEFAKKSSSDPPRDEDDDYDVPRNVKHMKISGRIVLDAWRVLRHEVALTSYTFENVMYHLSHERHPLLSQESLSRYWEHHGGGLRHLVVEHFVTRVLGLVEILDRLDFVNRTSELSRLFGIQFYEVLSRGSQFRVESMMLRLAKPLNYVPTSPSVSQRASMRAPASLPLILEPESLFYADPVVVLDFQSLYPSIIIAYNYCFSTCLGRVEKLGEREPFEFGCTQLQVSPEEVKKLEDDLTISPAGVAFVKSNVRKGILPAMLEEILETRLMVKKAMKENKENKVLQKVLFARQLGLKLIANVTYGYTAANFSGRMPCIEVGDSVVSKGRETLHRAIQLVKNTTAWGARVVYGDTDSIFVLTPGRSREEAFKIGAEIAEAVTRDNPKPVKLKLEKVYQPSILQTKKRYVGYVFESPDQKKPAFEAKGIETVRRDGCPAVGKILEKALRILFDTRDVSLVKKYTTRQFFKLYQGRVNIQDLIFAKEYRGRKGYRPGACVPALQLAKRWTQHDKRAEPRVKERVPYVIVNGPPGVPLIRLVRSPLELISDHSLRINAAYYITKAIVPPMQRCFSLLGADVASWYTEMPRKHHKTFKWSSAEGPKNTISQYFAALECVICSEVTTAAVCQKCEKEPQVLAVALQEKIRRWERRYDGLEEICRSCCGRPGELDCVSLDCPVLYRKKQAGRGEEEREALREILTRYL